nr:Folate-sensitive fragile site protein Fra10Ac1 domain containing protein [Haemonchus contortus]
MDTVKRNPDISVDDLQSEFDYQSEVERQKRKRCDLNEKNFSSLEGGPGRNEARAWFQDEHGRVHRQMSRMMTMDAYSRHKELINLYYLSHPGATKMLQRDTSKDRTDYDVLRDNHKFLWSEEDEAAVSTSWEARMAKKYYDKLFKGYRVLHH